MPGEMQFPDNFQRSLAAERLQGMAGKGADNLQAINQRKEGEIAQQRLQQAKESETLEAKNMDPDGKGNLSYNPRRKKRPPPAAKRPPKQGGPSQMIDLNA